MDIRSSWRGQSMARLLKITVLGWLIFVGVIICVTQPLFGAQDNLATVLAIVSNNGKSYLAAFTGGRVGANTQYQIQNFPPIPNAKYQFISHDGNWLFYVGPWAATTPQWDEVYYARRGGQFTTTPIHAWWPSTSADSQYLF